MPQMHKVEYVDETRLGYPRDDGGVMRSILRETFLHSKRTLPRLSVWFSVVEYLRTFVLHTWRMSMMLLLYGTERRPVFH